MNLDTSKSLAHLDLKGRLLLNKSKDTYLIYLQEMLNFTPEFKTQLKREYCKFMAEAENPIYEFDFSLSTLRFTQEMRTKECFDSENSAIKARENYKAEVSKRGDFVRGHSADVIGNLPVLSPVKRRQEFFSFQNIDNPSQENERLQEIAKRDTRLKYRYEEATAKLQQTRESSTLRNFTTVKDGDPVRGVLRPANHRRSNPRLAQTGLLRSVSPHLFLLPERS